MALDQVKTLNGLSDATMKFCFWIEDCRKQRSKHFQGDDALGPVETHDEYGEKINAAEMPVLSFMEYDNDASIGRDPEGYMWNLIRNAQGHAHFWQEREHQKAVDAVKLAHSNTKDAIRMRANRKAGKVKRRPPRPPRTLAQKVEDRRKMVDTRLAKMKTFKAEMGLHNMTMASYLSAVFKAEKSLASAVKALATAKRMLKESPSR